MFQEKYLKTTYKKYSLFSRAAVIHLNFRAGSTFPVPVCTVPSSMDRTSRCNRADAVRFYASYRLNLLLLKGQRRLAVVDRKKGYLNLQRLRAPVRVVHNL